MKRIILLAAVAATVLAAFGAATVLAGGGVNGSPGPTPQNVKGTTGGMPPTSQVMYAVVNADGTKAHGFPKNDVTSTNLGTGTYEVDFPQDITTCAYQATIGNASSGTAPNGFIQVDARAGQIKGVFVETTDTTGTLANRPFHLTVSC